MMTAVFVMVGIMAFASIALTCLAVAEFVINVRHMRSNQSQPVVVQQVVAEPVVVQQSVAEPVVAEPVVEQKEEEKVEEPVVEEVASTTSENSVTFGVAEVERQTIKDAYEELSDESKGFYDQIVEAAKELEMARIIESTYAVTVMQGRDTIGRLRILRGAVTLDCTVINPELAKYNKQKGRKIKSRPTRFRIDTQDELDAAIYTLRVANQTSLQNRNVKKKVEKGGENNED